VRSYAPPSLAIAISVRDALRGLTITANGLTIVWALGKYKLYAIIVYRNHSYFYLFIMTLELYFILIDAMGFSSKLLLLPTNYYIDIDIDFSSLTFQ
jgi:hypothetical protein